MDLHQRMSIDERLAELGVILPTPSCPVSNHERLLVVGNDVHVGAHSPTENGSIVLMGPLGDGADIEAGARAARLCLINILAQLEAGIPGGLDAISHVVRLAGYVAAVPGFAGLDVVMDGASDLAIALFGNSGRHIRTVTGVTALPGNASVAIDALFRL